MPRRALVDSIKEPLILGHLEPHRLAVGVGQRESHVTADAHALRVADEARAQPVDDGVVGHVLGPVVRDEAVAEAKPPDIRSTMDLAAEERRLGLELVERRGEGRAGDEPRACGADEEQSGAHLLAAAGGHEVRLVYHQTVHTHVAQHALREARDVAEHVWGGEQHVRRAQALQCRLLVRAASIELVDDERRRKLLELIGPLLHQRVVDDDQGEAH